MKAEISELNHKIVEMKEESLRIQTQHIEEKQKLAE